MARTSPAMTEFMLTGPLFIHDDNHFTASAARVGALIAFW